MMSSYFASFVETGRRARVPFVPFVSTNAREASFVGAARLLRLRLLTPHDPIPPLNQSPSI